MLLNFGWRRRSTMKSAIHAASKRSMSLEVKMPTICPAILAADKDTYRSQIEKIVHFAHRIQIDLTDGLFAPHKTIAPEDAWWPVGFKADFHLMFKDPMPAIHKILQ